MTNNNSEKLKRIKTPLSVSVFIVGIIFSVTTMLILLDAFKEYKSSISILVLPKSELIAQQSGDVVENIAEFPKMLSFYERLVKFNPQIKDDLVGMRPDEKKDEWNRRIDVFTENNNRGNIIILTVYGKTPAEAEMLSKKTATTLFSTVSNLYDIKTDLNISIIDGPFVTGVLRNIFIILLASLLIGFIASFLLNFLLKVLEKTVRPGIYSFDKSPLIGLKNKFSKKNEDIFIKNEDVLQDVPYDFEDRIIEEEFKAPNISVKNASAPANLPIAEDFEEFVEEKNVIELKKEEPNAEELRERLNKLLRGDM